MFDRYLRVIDFVRRQPWAVTAEYAAIIRDVLTMRAAGMTLTEKEIQARVGAREPNRPGPRVDGTVAVVPISGVISQKMSAFQDISGGTSTEKVTAHIRQLVADPNVGAIVLDIDSPGGGVFGVQELYDVILEARAQKRVVAVANSYAASAAYWIASAAEEIAVTPSGAVGSIGVYGMHEDLSKALEAEGVAITLISAGKYKVEGNPFEPLSEDARDAMQREVNAYYDLFVKAVAKGRGVSPADVRSGYGQGRVLNAKDALKAGLVDRVATLDETIARAAGARRRSADGKAADVPAVAPELLAAVEPVVAADAGAPAADVAAAAGLDLRRRRLRLAAARA